jgi:hypothetical protein
MQLMLDPAKANSVPRVINRRREDFVFTMGVDAPGLKLFNRFLNPVSWILRIAR